MLTNNMKTLLGKYQVKNNIFVSCKVYIVAANEHEIKAYLGVSKPGDLVVPEGVKIFLDAEFINRIVATRNMGYEVIFVKNLGVEQTENGPLHYLSPINKKRRIELRAEPRRDARFPVTVEGTDIELTCKNGTGYGLTLVYKPKYIVTTLSLDECYNFRVIFRGQEFIFNGRVKNIHYNWDNYAHQIGVYFEELEDEERDVLWGLIDPNYRVSEEVVFDERVRKTDKGVSKD